MGCQLSGHARGGQEPVGRSPKSIIRSFRHHPPFEQKIWETQVTYSYLDTILLSQIEPEFDETK
jgi:hypothetical protein